MAAITTFGVDADDTLWHNETIFRLNHARFVDLLSDFADEASIEARLAEVEHAEVGRVTVSMGVAELRAHETLASLIERVLQALYRAKHAGRNQISPG